MELLPSRRGIRAEERATSMCAQWGWGSTVPPGELGCRVGFILYHLTVLGAVLCASVTC